MWRILLSLMIALVLVVSQFGSHMSVEAEPKVVMDVTDPSGDDNGPGTYLYPSHESFQPYAGLFDLRRFKVATDERELVFQWTFGAVTNPFHSPEGFFHQLIDVYIDMIPDEGKDQPMHTAPYVRFSPEAQWDVRLLVAPFGRTRLFSYADPPGSPGRRRDIETRLLADGRTIEVRMPSDMLGNPRRGWKYYVLVGGFDRFEPDYYRPVLKDQSAWVFGGGDSEQSPRVLDMLAPKSGGRSQHRQLSAATGQVPILKPFVPRRAVPSWVWLALVLAAVGAAGVTVWHRRRS